MAQEPGPNQPYDPCPPESSLVPQCMDGSRICFNYNNAEFVCSPDYCWASGVIDDNAGIPASGVVTDQIIEIGSTYTITQGVVFKNCVFNMLGDSRINISPVTSGSAITKVTFQDCTFFNCYNMWQGIFVDASAAFKGLEFTFSNNIIEDAYIGLSLYELNSTYIIIDNSFRNNYIGISNLRQNGSALNASVVRNTFNQSVGLVTRTGSLLSTSMSGYPSSEAGIKYIRAITAVGATPTPSTAIASTANTFSCLTYGLETEAGVVTSTNNTFQDIKIFGIWATDGTMRASRCRFTGTGYRGIMTIGATLTATNNSFNGKCKEGIHAAGNINAEQLSVTGNNFTIAYNTWIYGIFIERPQANAGTHCTVAWNTFAVTASGGLACIYVADYSDATDVTQVAINSMTINDATGGGSGISVLMGNSDNFIVHDNNIHYGTICTAANFGISLFSAQNPSIGHLISYNNLSGIDVTSDPNHYAMTCGFHASRVQHTTFCENTINQSYRGFHFIAENDINLRENHLNTHYLGLRIDGGSGARIGIQGGCGNQWALDPNACINYAASVQSGANPLASRFIVPEGNVLPWLPPNNKLDPNPSLGMNWFHTGLYTQDYCNLSSMIAPTRKVTPYEKEVIIGTSTSSGVNLWELKLQSYTKLELFPSLRPSGSPEATFFYSSGNAIFGPFAQITQRIRNALTLSTIDQLAFDTSRNLIVQTLDNLELLDSSMDYSTMSNLSNLWFAQRAVLLQKAAVNALNEVALESIRNLQLDTILQSTLIYNAALATVQPYEAARKTLNELRIRHLLGQPMTQALYERALLLAQQDAASVGYANREVLPFLAPCDQALFPENEETDHERNETGNQVSLSPAGGIQVAPNPTGGLTELSLPQNTGGFIEAYNTNGEKMKTFSVDPGSTKMSLDLGNAPTGLYWLVFLDQTGKIIGRAKISIAH